MAQCSELSLTAFCICDAVFLVIQVSAETIIQRIGNRRLTTNK